MNLIQPLSKATFFAFSLLLITTTSCDLDFTSEKVIDEDSIREHLNTGATFVHVEAAIRLLDTINGETPDGVVLNVVGNRIDASIDADYDGNGSRETKIYGGVTFPNSDMSFDDGAEVRIDRVEGNPVDGSLTATATTTPTGAVTVIGSGEFTGRSDTSVDLELNLLVTPAASLVTGTVDLDTGDLAATAFYEDNGQGGFRVRVVGPDFEFTAY